MILFKKIFLIIVIRNRDRLQRDIRVLLLNIPGLAELYHQKAHNPQARIQRWFCDQAVDETSALYTDADLIYLIARVLESFASHAET